MKLLRRIYSAPIVFYRRHISPHFPAVCRYRPSCSAYALGAIERNPFSRGGWDPVPLKFDLLGRHRIPQPDPLSPAQRHALEYLWLLAPRTRWHGYRAKKR